MKTLKTAAAVIAAVAVVFLIYWLHGGDFERGINLGFTSIVAVIASLIASLAARIE